MAAAGGSAGQPSDDENGRETRPEDGGGESAGRPPNAHRADGTPDGARHRGRARDPGLGRDRGRARSDDRAQATSKGDSTPTGSDQPAAGRGRSERRPGGRGAGLEAGRRSPTTGGARPNRGTGQDPRAPGSGDSDRSRTGRPASGGGKGRAPGTRSRDAERRGARTASGAAREPRATAPRVDDDVSGEELDRSVRRQLAGLSSQAASRVERHLAMAARVVEADPELALEHARAARAIPGATRIAAVREATGLAAYAGGHYDEALAELKAARRISGSPDYLPVIADCERGLGRPQRALRVTADPDVPRLDAAGRAELLIVVAGAHRDLGRVDAAIVTLKVPALHSRRREPWVARLRYAYADALLHAGDESAALEWFELAAEVDESGETDAGERIADLQGIAFVVDDAPDSAEPGSAADEVEPRDA